MSALTASATHGRAALAVLAIIGLPMALSSVLLQFVIGLALRDGAGDPIVLQHLMWITASPEAVSGFFAVWLLFFGPWALGIWGTRARPTLWIGWEAYVRYLVVALCAAAIVALGRVLSAQFPVPMPGVLLLGVLTQALALFVLLRLAPAAPSIRAGGHLRLRETWRATSSDRFRLLALASLWTALGIVVQVVAEIVAISVSYGLAAMELAPSVLLLVITLGAPGLVTGAASAVVGLVTIALFWSVAERA